jgi:hypothetical protein
MCLRRCFNYVENDKKLEGTRLNPQTLLKGQD